MLIRSDLLRRSLLVAAVVFATVNLVLWLGMAVAGAQEVVSDGTIGGATVVTLSPLVVSFLTGTITPLVAGLATREWASSSVKAIVGLVTAVVGATIAWLIDHQGGFVLADFGLYFAMVFVAHVATYYGAWKPLGSANGAFTIKAPIGFGGPNPNA